MAAWLEVSRAPVREAFTRLIDQGLIVTVPQVGSRVARISMRGVTDAVFIRHALEKAAFERAVTREHLDTTEMQVLVNHNREAAMRGDEEDFFVTDEQLHEQLFVLAEVPQMWKVVRGTKIQLDRVRRLQLRPAMANEKVLEEYQLIVDALDDRDAVLGATVIYRHLHRALPDTARFREGHPDLFAD